jgi:CubicO group peptidase (beta-lactamase class C family)
VKLTVYTNGVQAFQSGFITAPSTGRTNVSLDISQVDRLRLVVTPASPAGYAVGCLGGCYVTVSNRIVGQFVGDGSGLTNLPTGSGTGDAVLGAGQTWTGVNTFSNATRMASLTVSNSLAATNVALYGAVNLNSLTGGNMLQVDGDSPGMLTGYGQWNLASVYATNFTGNGGSLTNINAARATNVFPQPSTLVLTNLAAGGSGTNVVIDLSRGNSFVLTLNCTNAFFDAVTNYTAMQAFTVIVNQGTNGLIASTNTVNFNTNYWLPPTYGQILTMPTNTKGSAMVINCIMGSGASNPTNRFTQTLFP